MLGRSRWIGVFAAGLTLSPFAIGLAPAQEGPDSGQPPGVEVLTRGPIHEAFAEPLVFDPKAGPIIPKQPPPAIREVPPDQAPEGGRDVWIPGYWAWDDERQDYLWVSGLWREPPPGRQWVPGYWGEVQGGFQWVPGAWMPADQGQVQYLPQPPASLEGGPTSPQPQGEYTWAPGSWVWQDGNYAWRPGYWVPVRNDWLWVPAHYNYTPNGYLYSNGYWDYPFANRGQMFAPAYFSQPLYNQPNFAYTPSVGLLAGGLLSSLFIRPSYHQYYFGDYYGQNNFQSGIYPWYSYHQSRYGYDPIYAQVAAVEGRRNPQWAQQMHEQYAYRREHEEARPARTFAAQRSAIAPGVVNAPNNLVMARHISQLNERGGAEGRPLRPMTPERREQAQVQAEQMQRFREHRLQQEREAARPRPTPQPHPRSLDLPRSPVVATEHPAERFTPPRAPELPRVNPQVRPQPVGEAPRRFEPHPEMRPPWPPHAAPAPVPQPRPTPARAPEPRPAPKPGKR